MERVERRGKEGKEGKEGKGGEGVLINNLHNKYYLFNP